MGERIDSFEKSTAPEKISQELGERTFSNLSQCIEGLSNIPQESLEDFLYERDNVEDILYLFKFITDRETYLRLATEEYSSFNNLNEKQQKEIKELASLFHGFFTEVPIFNETSSVNLDEGGSFIAFVNKRNQRLDVSWKKQGEKAHLFHKLLEKVNSEGDDYPDSLRSTGMFNIYLDEEDVINISFSGDASKKIFSYAPSYLKNFELELIEWFGKKFKTKDIKIHF